MQKVLKYFAFFLHLLIIRSYFAPDLTNRNMENTTQDYTQTARVSMIIRSHSNDFNIDGEDIHLGFIQHLERRYPDTSVQIDPIIEWDLFQKNRESIRIKTKQMRIKQLGLK